MIPLRINNKIVNIPKFDELTVKQYRAILPFISEAGYIDAVRYVSVTTGMDYVNALDTKIPKLLLINTMLGEFMYITGGKETLGDNIIENAKPHLIIKVRDRYIDLRKFKPDAVGYRIVLEQFLNSKPTYLDLYLFMAAAVLHENFDFDEIIDLQHELEGHDAFEILTLGAFFFWKWKSVESRDSLFLRTLKWVVRTSVQVRRPALELIDSKSITRLKK